MKTLQDYIAEAEEWMDDPQVGDAFDIELAPDHLIETVILETTADGIVIEADEHLERLLESRGWLAEKIGTYGAVGYGGMGQTFFEKDQVAEHGGGIGPRGHWQSMMDEQGVAEGILGDREYNRVMPVVKRIAGEVSDYDRDEFGEELWSLLDQKYGSKFAQSVLQDSLDFYWDEYAELTGQQGVAEGAMKELAIELEDYKRMSPQEFERAYGMKKADWAMKHHDIIGKENLQVDWTGKTGFDYVKETSAYMARMLELAGVADHKYDKADAVYHEDQDSEQVAAKELDRDAAQALGEESTCNMTAEGESCPVHGLEECGSMEEAKYQGREVKLGKPFLTPGGPKKRSVYVKNPKGNVVKVNFGDPKMRIKKSNPARRKSFRSRHNCANPGPRHKARFWSCRMW